MTTCQSPDHEDPVTDGRWRSWKKVAVKLLECSLVENGVGIKEEVNALVVQYVRYLRNINYYYNYKDNRIIWFLMGQLMLWKK